MKRMYLAAMVGLYAFSHSDLASAQNIEELRALILEGKKTLSQPGKIPEMSQKIQKFFSNSDNKSLFALSEAKQLAQLQNRFISYQRLASELGNWSCNVDSTRMSEKSQEILQNSLSAPVCSEISPEYLQDFKKASTLIEEVKMIELQFYSGDYAINDEGDMVFPWEVENEKAKYEWKSRLNTVVIKKNGSVPSEDLNGVFEPHSQNNIAQFKDELYRQSLKDTFATYMYLHTAYGNEKLKPQKLADDFCKEKRTFWNRLTGKNNFAQCPKSIKNFILKAAKAAVKNKNPESYEIGAGKLNAEIAKLNKVLEKIQKNTKIVYQYNGKTGDKYVADTYYRDKAQAKKDVAEFNRLHREVSSSGPGLFIATDELFKKLGPKDGEPLSFQEFYPPVLKSEFRAAVHEAQGHTFDHAQELLSIYEGKGENVDKVKELLKLNPAAASNVLINHPEYGGTACLGLKNLSVEEMNDKQLRMVATWGGAIVGGAVAFTGIGAIPVAIVGAIAATPDMAMSYKHFEQASAIRDSGFAELNGAKAIKETGLYKTAKSEAVTAGAFMGAGILADVYFGLKAGKASKVIFDEVAVAEELGVTVAKADAHKILIESLPEVSRGAASKALDTFEELGFSPEESANLYKQFEKNFDTVLTRSPAGQSDNAELLAAYINKQKRAGKSTEAIKERLARAFDCKNP
jgi:hypothetical protein